MLKFNSGDSMKNNEGFTLVGVMIISAVLAVIVTTGIVVMNYRAKQQDASKISFRGNQVQTNLNNISEPSLEQMGTMQFNDATGTTNRPAAPAHANRMAAAIPAATPPCPAPCNYITDPFAGSSECVISDSDLAQCTNLTERPAGCGVTTTYNAPSVNCP